MHFLSCGFSGARYPVVMNTGIDPFFCTNGLTLRLTVPSRGKHCTPCAQQTLIVILRIIKLILRFQENIRPVLVFSWGAHVLGLLDQEPAFNPNPHAPEQPVLCGRLEGDALLADVEPVALRMEVLGLAGRSPRTSTREGRSARRPWRGPVAMKERGHSATVAMVRNALEFPSIKHPLGGCKRITIEFVMSPTYPVSYNPCW